MPSQLILPPAPGEIDLLLPSRRKLLCASAAFLATVSTRPFAQTMNFWDIPRELWLRRPSTGEELRAVYWADGKLVPEGYQAICTLMRDTHQNKTVQMDLVTLDIARGMYGWLKSFGIPRPLIINSGYRDPKTNASEGGVRNSLHTKAKALDLRIEGVSTESVTRYGLYLAGGGVGFYPGKEFTHVDSGQIRFWRG